ncbi:MAG: hypothetical protein MJ127_04425 [Mogibacterium sp.]|nr:hypothetical protein [Mogibacterium sp.]
MNKKIGIKTTITVVVLTVMMVASAVTDQVYAFATFTGQSPYSGVAYSSYYHNKDKFNGDVILNGIDVSTYQSGSKSSWAKARDNGVDFAILRVTATGYGSAGNKFTDSEFEKHYKNAKAAGLMVGVYVFSQAITEDEAKSEVDYAVKRLNALGIGPKDLDLPLYMDYEFAGSSSTGRMQIAQSKGKFSKTKATSCAKAFCERVKSYGYEPGIYANKSFLTSTIDGAALGKSYRIWTAQYYNKAEFTGAYDVWQYSSAAKIDGIYNSDGKKVSVDVNFWYLNPNRSSAVSTDLANSTVSGAADVLYTGNQVKPKYTVQMGEKTLTEGKDYRVGYARNIKIGTAYAYIRGLGAYSGYKLVQFNIVNKLPDPQDAEGEPVENLGIGNFVKHAQAVEETEGNQNESEDGSVESPEDPVEETEGALIPLISLATDAEAAGYLMSEKELSGVIKGTTAAAVKQAVKLDESCSEYSVHVISRIGEELDDSLVMKTGSLVDIRDVEGQRVASLRIVVDGTATITLSSTSYKYDGNVKRPSVTVKFGEMTAAKSATKGNDYFSLYYPSGCKTPGTYKITIKGKGCFAGTFTSNYKIAVAGTSLKKVERAGKGNFKAYWKKKSSTYITGYQLQYSRHSDMSLYLKKTVKSYKTTSAKITKRHRGYKYYIRIRTYKTINGKKYYSPWSDKKTVKVK